MESSKSNEFSSSSSRQGQMHNFMPMPALGLADHNRQDGGEGKHSPFMQSLKCNIDLFWSQRMVEIQNTQDFKGQHQLPLSRIKKIMKSDEEVKMISADTPILFSKACELFVLELTVRAWLHTEQNRRRTLQRSDIARAIRNDDLLDFLVDVVRLEQHHQIGARIRRFPNSALNPKSPEVVFRLKWFWKSQRVSESNFISGNNSVWRRRNPNSAQIESRGKSGINFS
ncbi:hypothetical protein U1Q18_045889, partial [Sarracenia purpurea var. burkii]